MACPMLTGDIVLPAPRFVLGDGVGKLRKEPLDRQLRKRHAGLQARIGGKRLPIGSDDLTDRHGLIFAPRTEVVAPHLAMDRRTMPTHRSGDDSLRVPRRPAALVQIKLTATAGPRRLRWTNL